MKPFGEGLLQSEKSIACRPMTYSARFANCQGSRHDGRSQILQDSQRLSHRAGGSSAITRARGRHRPATPAPPGGVRPFLGTHVFKWTEIILSVGAEGGLCE